MKETIKTLRLLGSAIIYRISGKKILTKTGQDFLKEKREQWKEKAHKIQEELDAEHGRGWGIRQFDGKKKEYESYTKASIQKTNN